MMHEEMTMNLYRLGVAVTTAGGSHAGHELGDYAVQPDWCARLKQQRTAKGRMALLVHGLSYAATQHATKAAFYRTAGIRVPVVAQLAGTMAEGLAHVIIDDGRLLKWFAHTTGKGGFFDLGGPRRVVPVLDEGNHVRRIHLVAADAKGNPTSIHRTNEDLVDAGPHDNPSPSTGRALLDQAVHKGIQIPLGVAVTTALAVWMRRPR